VMYQQLMLNLIPRHTEITAIVSIDNLISNLLPFPGTIKLLIDPAIETEGGLTYLPTQ